MGYNATELLANDVTVDTFLEYFKLINTPLCNSRVLSLYLRTYGPIVRSGDRGLTLKRSTSLTPPVSLKSALTDDVAKARKNCIVRYHLAKKSLYCNQRSLMSRPY